MSSRIPKTPLQSSSTNKTLSGKNVKTITSSINNPKKEISKPNHEISQNKKQVSTKKTTESQKPNEKAKSSIKSSQPNLEGQNTIELHKIDQKETPKTSPEKTAQKEVEIQENLNENSEPKNSHPEEKDSKLGEQIRFLFQQENDNEAIIQKVKLLTEFVESASDGNNDSIEAVIEDMKNRIEESETLKTKHDQILKEKDIIEKKLKKLEQQFHESQNQFSEEDKENYRRVKSTYPNWQFNFEDIDLSLRVRSIFNNEENNEAIVRTIESNIETVKDDGRVSELIVKLEVMNRKVDQLNQNHLIEQKEKNSQLEAQANEIEQLKDQINNQKDQIDNQKDQINNQKDQINNQKDAIQKLEAEIENEKQKLIEKDKEICDLKQTYEAQIIEIKEEIQAIQTRERSEIELKENEMKNTKDAYEARIKQLVEEIKLNKSMESKVIESEITEIKKKYKKKLNDFQNNLLYKDNAFVEMRNELSELKQIGEQKEKENIELRKLLENSDDVKSQEIEYLKRSLLIQLTKQKEFEMSIKSKDEKETHKKANLQLHNQLVNKQKEINQLIDEISHLKSTIEDLKLKNTNKPSSKSLLYAETQVNAEEQNAKERTEEQNEEPEEKESSEKQNSDEFGNEFNESEISEMKESNQEQMQQPIKEDTLEIKPERESNEESGNEVKQFEEEEEVSDDGQKIDLIINEDE